MGRAGERRGPQRNRAFTIFSLSHGLTAKRKRLVSRGWAMRCHEFFLSFPLSQHRTSIR